LRYAAPGNFAANLRTSEFTAQYVQYVLFGGNSSAYTARVDVSYYVDIFTGGRMKLRSLFLAGAVFSAGSLSAAAVLPICPTTSSNVTGADATGCGVLITMGTSGATIAITATGPFDGVEDTTVGVINNSLKPLTSLTLTATDASGAFGFEGDGIQTFTSVNGVVIGSGGATTYEGPTSTFSLAGVDAAGGGTLVVKLSTAIAASGGSTYFSLEGNPATAGGGISVGGAVPEPGTFGALGAGLLGLAGLVRCRRSRS
jgi:PEP-CTERM motif